MHWTLQTPTPLLLPSLYLPVWLSLYSSPYFIPFLVRLTPLNSILPHSLYFLPFSLPTMLPPSRPPPTSVHHALISSHLSWSVSLHFHPLCFSSVQFHSWLATERSRSRLILCLNTTSQLILNPLLALCVRSLGMPLLSMLKCQSF